MNTEKTTYTIQTVDKAFEILEILSDASGGLSLALLADKAGLSRNKTFRLTSTLCEKGLLEQDRLTGNYRLGIFSFALAQKFLHNASLINYAHPVMEELVRKHDEAVYMTVIRDDEVIFLDMVDCDQNIKATPMIGKKMPFFTTAAGKVLKALDSRDLWERFFRKRGKKTTMPDFDLLESELNEIRARGVAIDCGVLGDGIISVAVAFRDYAGSVIGALTMLGPSFRMLSERLESEIIPSMLEEAQVLSEKFGYARI